MTNRDVLTNYVYTITNALKQQGVEQVVISPGSRSTPLAYAFMSTEGMHVSRQVDERSAGFFALGLAKATAKPVVLLCTSGTAAANYFPAIVEAKYARVPLIVITADRPHELREVGAPQTINQVRLFGESVKWSSEFPIPDDAPISIPYIERHTVRAMNIAIAAPMGPVHLNVPFREPLLIDFDAVKPHKTFTKAFINQVTPNTQTIEALIDVTKHAKRGLLVVGEQALNTNLQHIWAFIRQMQMPVLVESLSNLRGNVPVDCLPYVITTYDALLKSADFKKKMYPDLVIRLGAQPISKFAMNFLAEAHVETYVVIDEDPIFRDSTHAVTHYVHAHIGEWLTQLEKPTTDANYLADWQRANIEANKLISTQQATDEGVLVRTLLENVPNETDIFVSSSMPVRDIDTYFAATNKDIQIFANRGANGIDGVMSTALGFSNGRVNRTAYVLIGDLAFLHDLNAFIATKYQPCDLTIVVMNNDGGGIFSYLPQASEPKYYEDLFGTPTGLTFSEVAKMYDFQYDAVHSIEQLQQSVAAKKETAVRIIEVFTDRQTNTEEHRQLWQAIQQQLASW